MFNQLLWRHWQSQWHVRTVLLLLKCKHPSNDLKAEWSCVRGHSKFDSAPDFYVVAFCFSSVFCSVVPSRVINQKLMPERQSYPLTPENRKIVSNRICGLVLASVDLDLVSSVVGDAVASIIGDVVVDSEDAVRVNPTIRPYDRAIVETIFFAKLPSPSLVAKKSRISFVSLNMVLGRSEFSGLQSVAMWCYVAGNCDQ